MKKLAYYKFGDTIPDGAKYLCVRRIRREEQNEPTGLGSMTPVTYETIYVYEVEMDERK